MKNDIQKLRKEALVRNPNFEGSLDKKYIKKLIKDKKGLDDFSDSSDLEIFTSLNYRLDRFEEIKLSEYADEANRTTTNFIYTYFIELMYIRGYSYTQIENIIQRIKKLNKIQPELSIMGLDF